MDPQEWWCPRCQTWTGPCEDADRCETCGTPLMTERDRVRLRDLGLSVTELGRRWGNELLMKELTVVTVTEMWESLEAWAITVTYSLIPIGALKVDISYQRPLGKKKVATIAAAGINPVSVGDIFVAQREDGSFWILDGQHRVSAMKKCGVTHAHCKVFQGLTYEQEAKAWYDLNVVRAPAKAIDQIRPRLAFRDQVAADIQRVAESAGLKLQINNHTPSTNGVQAVAALEFIYHHGGANDLLKVLRVVVAAWPDDPKARGGMVLRGVWEFMRRYTGEVDDRHLVDKLQAAPVSQILRHARGLTMEYGGHSSRNIARVIWRLYNKGKSKNRLPNKFDAEDNERD